MKTKMTWRKKLGAMIAALFLSGVMPLETYALPTESTVNPDERNIQNIEINDKLMNIIGSGTGLNSFIRWNDFSIGRGETVNFSNMQKILNLVDGTNVSNIFGTMKSDPGIHVFLLNPNGVIFGAGSQVDVGSLTVSGRTISEEAIAEFISNGTLPTITDDDLTGGIVFLGKLKADKLVAEGNNISVINSENSAETDSETFFSDNTPGFSVQDSAELKVTSYGHVDMPYKSNFDSEGNVTELADSGSTKQTLDSKFTAENVRNDFDIIKTAEDFGKIATTPAGHFMIVKDNLTLTDSIKKADGTALTFTGAINGLGNTVNLQSSFFTPGSTLRNATLSNTRFSVPASGLNLNSALIADALSYNTFISNIFVDGGKISFSGISPTGVFGYANASGTSVLFENVSNSTNMTVDNSARYVGGLIGYSDASNGTTFKYSRNAGDITVDTLGSSKDVSVGGLIGYTKKTTFDNVRNSGKIIGNTGTSGYIGGIVGYINNKSTISNAHNTGKMEYTTGTSGYVGGIIGYGNDILTFSDVHNTADIEYAGKEGSAGGIAGFLNYSSTFQTAHNTGKISATNPKAYYVGGLIGGAFLGSWGRGAAGLTLKDVYNTGVIEYSGAYHSGGIVGASGQINIENAYNTGKISVLTGEHAGGIVGYANGVSNVLNAYNTADIEYNGSQNAGGIAGYVTGNSVFQTAYNTGKISVTNSGAENVGGLVGGVNANLKMSDVHNDGNIEYAGERNMGGIVGRAAGYFEMSDSYNIGKIASTGTGSEHIGGLAGYVGYSVTDAAKITNSYNKGDIETNGSSSKYAIGGLIGEAGYYRGNLVAENLRNEGKITVNNTSGPVGGIVGHVQGRFDIKDSHNKGEINTNNSDSVGGIAGTIASVDVSGQINLGALLENVHNDADITVKNINSSGNVGGIFGYGYKSLTLTDAHNIGTITNYGKGSAGGIGGYIVGHGEDLTTIKKVYNTGKIYSFNENGGYTGGLLGFIMANDHNDFIFGETGTENLNYNSGDIYYAGNKNSGGIIGRSEGTGTITNVKNTGVITTTNSSAGSVGGIIGTFSSGYYEVNPETLLENIPSYIKEAENTTDINYSGTGALGGIVGSTMGVSIFDSTNRGNLTRTGGGSNNGGDTGGIIGNSSLSIQRFENLENYGDILLSGTNTAAVGGIYGYSGRNAYFDNVTNYGNITGTTNMGNTGGVIGEANWKPFFKDAYNKGNITYTGSDSPSIGGIIGYTETELEFNGTRNTGNISSTGTGNVGGIVGRDWSSALITLNDVYNEGSITVENNDAGDVGGIIGYTNGHIKGENVGNLASAKITYWGQKNVGGLIGGISDERTVATDLATTVSLKNAYNIADIDARKITKTYKPEKSGAGGIVGYIWTKEATFENVYNKGDIKYNGAGYLAGIIGRSLGEVTLKGSVYNQGNLTGTNAEANEAGGIMALSQYAMLLGGESSDENALTIYNNGKISYAGKKYLGGILGDVENDLTMQNVYNSGNLTTANSIDVGGLVGHVKGIFTGKNLENRKSVEIDYSGTGNIGGILGKGDSTVELENSTNFADLTSLTGSNIGGLVGMAGGKFTAKEVKNTGEITFGKDDGSDMTFKSGNGHIAGIVGYVDGEVYIDGARNTGKIQAKAGNVAESGGVLGFGKGDATIKNAYNYGNINYNGNSNLGGVTGQLEGSATLENLYNYGILNITNENAHSAGGVFASTKMKNYYTVTLKNAENYGDIIFNGGGDYKVGGIMGYGRNISIENVYNKGNITVSNPEAGAAGGIIGVFSNQNATTGSSIIKGENGQIKNEGNIDYSGAKYVGGIIGESDIGTSLDGAINTGNLTAHSGEGLGGMYGYLNATENNQIINSTNSGSLKSAGNNVGGIVGVLETATVEITDTKNLVAIETFNEGDNEVSENIGGAIGWANNISSDFKLNDFETSQKFIFGKNAKNVGAVIGKYTGKGNGEKITINKLTNKVNFETDKDLENVGGFIGYIEKVSGEKSFSNIKNEGNFKLTGKSTNVGGILGFDDSEGNLTINGATNSGNIEVSSTDTNGGVGGILGKVSKATVNFEDGISLGNIKGGENAIVGGLVGYVAGGDFTLKHSYNLGQMESENIVGGLVGSSDIATDSKFKIEQSFNAEKVIDDEIGGGLIGYLKTGTLTDAYNAGEISGSGTNSTIGGIIGKSGSVTLEQVYNFGNLSGSGTKGNIIGATEADSTVTLKNVHYLNITTTSADPIGNDAGSIADGSTYEQNTEEQMYKPSTYANYDLDETGESQKTAVWRIYEGYKTPFLTYFMKPGIVKVFHDDRYIQYNHDGNEKIFGSNRVTFYDGSGNSISNDYTNFVEAKGTAEGDYIGGVYSEQLGYNFVYKKKDSTDNDPTNTATNLSAPDGVTLPGNGVMLRIGTGLENSSNPGETEKSVTITITDGVRTIDGIEWGTSAASEASYTSTLDLTNIIKLSEISVEDNKASLSVMSNGENYSVVDNGTLSDGNQSYTVTVTDEHLNKTIYKIIVDPGEVKDCVITPQDMTITADSGSKDIDGNITSWNNPDWTNNINFSDSFLASVPGANILVKNGNTTTVNLSGNSSYSKFTNNGDGTYTVITANGKNDEGQYLYNQYNIKVVNGTITDPETSESKVVITVGDAHKKVDNTIDFDNTTVSFDGEDATVLTENHTYDKYYELNKNTVLTDGKTTAKILENPENYSYKKYTDNNDGTYTILVDLGVDETSKVHQYKTYNVKVIDGKLIDSTITNTNLTLKVEDAVKDFYGNVTYASGRSTGTYTLKDSSGTDFEETIPVTVSEEGVHIVGNRTTVTLESTTITPNESGSYIWNNVSDNNYTQNNYSLNLVEGRVLDPAIETIPITIKVPNATESNGSVTYSDNITISGLPEGDTFANTLNLSEISRNGNSLTVGVNTGAGYVLTQNGDGTYTAFVVNGRDETTGVYLYTNYIISIEPGLLTSIVPTPSPVVPTSPTNPTTPEIEVPDVPEIPTATEIEEPKIPEVPTTTEIEEPKVPEVPTTLEIEETKIPEVPTATEIEEPKIPEAPTATEIEEPEIPEVPTKTDDVDDVKIMTHVQTGWYSDIEQKTTILAHNDDQDRASGTSQSESDNIVIDIDTNEEISKTFDNVVLPEDVKTSTNENLIKEDNEVDENNEEDEVDEENNSESFDEKSAAESNEKSK